MAITLPVPLSTKPIGELSYIHTCSRVLMDQCGLGGCPTLPYSLSLEEFFKTDRISKNIEPNIAKIHIQGFDIKDENQLLSKR